MVDTRFHPTAGPILLGAALAALGRTPRVDAERAAALTLSGADDLDVAVPTDLGLAAHRDYRDALLQTEAGAVVVHPDLEAYVPPGTLAIVEPRAHELFVDLLQLLYPFGTRDMLLLQMDEDGAPPFLEPGVRLAPGVTVGTGVEIGRNTVIGPNTTIGRGVTIGRNCVIAGNVSIECAHIGNNVVLHPGARIGLEGFGWLQQGRSNRKIPQLGRVIVQDNVEIGANSSVDRGALGDTVVGEGTKIDKLVGIGHNCRIGRMCLIAGGAGMSGGTVTGDSVMFGMRATSAGHLSIGSGSVLAANSLVSKDVPPGAMLAGYPAQDLKSWRREVATLRRLSRRGQQ